MKAYVGITDNDWFRFLRSKAPLEEVNFWQPSGNRPFRTLQPGEPFLFKLHSPENFIVGGGFFTHFSFLPVSLAWEAFGEGNGVRSLTEMRQHIEKYRRITSMAHEDYTIGCIILQSLFFFSDDNWIPVPKDFHLNIVQGKSYDLATSVGKDLWEAVQQRIQIIGYDQIAESAPIYGAPSLVATRLGQGAFRVLVTDTYSRRCAVTGEKALPVLEAAHIRPVSEGGAHRVDNGLLLRSDVHTLFDRGYVTVTPDYRFRVSKKLEEDFHNGEHYYQLQNSELWIPQRNEQRPSSEFLEWHADTIFRA